MASSVIKDLLNELRSLPLSGHELGQVPCRSHRSIALNIVHAVYCREVCAMCHGASAEAVKTAKYALCGRTPLRRGVKENRRLRGKREAAKRPLIPCLAAILHQTCLLMLAYLVSSLVRERQDRYWVIDLLRPSAGRNLRSAARFNSAAKYFEGNGLNARSSK